MQLNLLPTIQQAIANLLTVYEPEFLRFGYSLFLSFATILIVWQGVKMMFSHDNLGDSMFDFAKLLMLISFGYAFIAFYEAPIPGIGVSFSNLITDQTGYFQSVLEARAFDNIYRHFDELSDHFLQPDAWSILANLIYWAMLLLIALAKGLSLAVIAFVLYLAMRSAGDQWLARIGFALIIGGAVGNLIDRAVYGHVIDYILFHTPVWSFAVFNLADAFITVGAVIVSRSYFNATA